MQAEWTRKRRDSYPHPSFLGAFAGHEQETFLLGIDYLRSVKYDSDELAATIQVELKNEFERKAIPRALYEASCGAQS